MSCVIQWAEIILLYGELLVLGQTQPDPVKLLQSQLQMVLKKQERGQFQAAAKTPQTHAQTHTQILFSNRVRKKEQLQNNQSLFCKASSVVISLS